MPGLWNNDALTQSLAAIQNGQMVPQFARVAEELQRQKKIDEAVAICETHLLQFPNYATGHLVLARLYHEKNRLEEARQEYGQVLKLDPENLAAFKGLGDVFLAFGEKGLALWHYRRAAEIDPLSAEVGILVAELSRDEGAWLPAPPTLPGGAARDSRPVQSQAGSQELPEVDLEVEYTPPPLPKAPEILKAEFASQLGQVKTKEVDADQVLIGFEETGTAPVESNRAELRPGGAPTHTESLAAHETQSLEKPVARPGGAAPVPPPVTPGVGAPLRGETEAEPTATARAETPPPMDEAEAAIDRAFAGFEEPTGETSHPKTGKVETARTRPAPARPAGGLAHPLFETESIADIYARQGLGEQALKIYRKLLTQKPDNPVLQEKIKRVESQLSAKTPVK